MLLGRITGGIDLPQVAFWLFFLFFLGLVFVLRRNDKREGYPMQASPFDDTSSLGFPLPPAAPTLYQLNEGGYTTAPHYYPQPPTRAEPRYRFDGTPLSPLGDPLTAALGPGAYVIRRDEPMLTEAGEPMLQPFRNLPDWKLAQGQTDLRGMTVFDWRWRNVGIVDDFWIDRSIEIIRQIEVTLHRGGRVLVPIFHTVIDETAREIRVTSLSTHQFAAIPMPADPNVISACEDERLNAYFAAGRFWRESPLTGEPDA